MIYKFIDNNGAEITLNSLSSLQALIESQTIKKDTKVKAGLRGKWVQAADIDEIKYIYVTKETDMGRTTLLAERVEEEKINKIKVELKNLDNFFISLM